MCDDPGPKPQSKTKRKKAERIKHTEAKEQPLFKAPELEIKVHRFPGPEPIKKY